MSRSEHSSPLIETVGLKKYFHIDAGQLHAVDDISLSISPGETLGLVGESGCGKSTFGRALLRLIEPTAGQVFYKGEDILKLDKAGMKQKRREMQIIFQDPYSSINPRMSVAEIIAEYLIVNKVYEARQEAFNHAAKLMDIVGLARRFANSYPHELDGGRRQRIGIARALSLNPEFIVCDEPVSALDVAIQAQILNLLMDLQDEFGLTYLFITHNLSVVKHISTEIAVMYLGQCVEKASTDELFENSLHPYTRALIASIPYPDISMRTREVELIRGEVTSPIDPPPGCRFAPRCEQVMDICRNVTPLLKKTSGEGADDHLVACHLYS
ncbi:MAG: ABC transporter ATP-binding protein [Synergistaceae bacterium]|nr:ABC transporter ATP-binding protein [Synergistaceae bacterium]